MPEPKRTPPFPLVAATVIGLVWLSGCMSPSPAKPSASGAGAQPSAPSACEDVDLRLPSGPPLDLTDRWRSPDGGTYYLRQVGSCVWFGGFSGDTGAPDVESSTTWTNSFFGHLASDFTLRGEWADLPWGFIGGVGVLVWSITFADVDGEEAVTLTLIEQTGGFGAGYLVVPVAREELTVRLQVRDECLAVISDTGETYELASMPLGWSLTTLGLAGPNGEEIRESDSLRVDGEVARGEGFCGPGRHLFADELEVSAAP